jgi:hypothetical protein
MTVPTNQAPAKFSQACLLTTIAWFDAQAIECGVCGFAAGPPAKSPRFVATFIRKYSVNLVGYTKISPTHFRNGRTASFTQPLTPNTEERNYAPDYA